MNPRFPPIIPNLLSFLRILIGIVIPFLLLYPPGESSPWALGFALVLFLVGVLTDFWDGWVARRHKMETPLGRILDPTADKIFILSAMASFAARGMYSYWYLVPIFFREIAVTFCRVVWLGQGQAVGAERAGKVKFGLQVTSVLFSFIFLIVPNPATLRINSIFLWLAMLTTLYSGVFFFAHNRRLLEDRRFLGRVAALGVGYLRPFPGTYGSLVGLLLVPFVAHDFLLHLLLLSVLLRVAYAAIPRLGLGESEDPLEIVIDECCGILLAFLAVPVHGLSLLTGFVLFRFFDVTKVFPIGWLEKKKGVNGIMLDDLGAGVYTWVILKALFH